uniref:Uncharacterized protein n=1 Tax=Romanomermis culicivorax TaxID=13658 RepID=A0A915KW95_ROMCU
MRPLEIEAKIVHEDIGAVFDFRNRTLTIANIQITFNIQCPESPLLALMLPPPPVLWTISSQTPSTAFINETTLAHPVISMKNVLIQPYTDHIILGTIWSCKKLETPSPCIVSSNDVSLTISIKPAIINPLVEQFPMQHLLFKCRGCPGCMCSASGVSAQV